MKKIKVLNKTTQVDRNFDDWLDEISNGWERKAARLQQRRWNKLREEDMD